MVRTSPDFFHTQSSWPAVRQIRKMSLEAIESGTAAFLARFGPFWPVLARFGPFWLYNRVRIRVGCVYVLSLYFI